MAKEKHTPTTEQQAIRNHAGQNPRMGRKCISFAGSGKTSTLEMLAEDNRAPGLYLAFNRAIKEEASKRFPRHIKVVTAHGAAYGALQMHQHQNRLNQKIYGDSVQRLIRLPRCRMHPDALGQVVLDSIARFCNSADAEPDMSHIALDPKEPEDLRQSALIGTKALWEKMISRHSDCPITHDTYLKLWQLNQPSIRNVEWAMFDEAQDASPVMIDIMAKQRLPITFVGDPHQCHPLSTKITVTGRGEIPITEVKEGDLVATYGTNKSTFRGLKTQGRKVEHVHRSKFTGNLIEFSVGNKKLTVTPNHRCLVRFNKTKKHALYLMRKSGRYRIGIADLHYLRGNGVTLRARQEHADASWILSVFPDKIEARIAEEKFSAMFGIPQLLFVDPKCRPHVQYLYDRAWEEIGDNEPSALKILKHFGKLPEYPFWEKGGDLAKHGNTGKYSFVVQACNVIDECMSMAILPNGPFEVNACHSGQWHPVKSRKIPYDGDVIGLQVEPTEGGRRLYIADGVVTHNSIYQWRGAVNAMREMPGAEFPLTQSFRFGADVAQLANAVLANKPEWSRPSHSIVGNPNKDSVLGKLTPITKHAFISRTNAEWFSEALAYQGWVHVIGGLDETEKLLKGAYQLWRNNQRPQNCPAVSRFSSWRQLCEHAEQFDDRELMFARRVIESYKETLPRAMQDLRRRHTDSEDDAHLILTTAHKSKGKEWSYVRLGEGFVSPLDEGWEKMTDSAREAELNLLYVALTRAIDGLQPNTAVIDCLKIATSAKRSPLRLKTIDVANVQPVEPQPAIPAPRLSDGSASVSAPNKGSVSASAIAPWSPEQDAEVTMMVENGFSVDDIAEWCGRSPLALALRLSVLGIKGYDRTLLIEAHMALVPPLSTVEPNPVIQKEAERLAAPASRPVRQPSHPSQPLSNPQSRTSTSASGLKVRRRPVPRSTTSTDEWGLSEAERANAIKKLSQPKM